MPYEFTHLYPRNNADFYVEPKFCVECLFNNYSFAGAVHDPACGIGTVLEVAKLYNSVVTGADLIERGYGEVRDFLTDIKVYDNIITNPPYNLAEAFFHHAYSHVNYSISLLTRLAWLEGQKRYKTIYKPYPPTHVLVFSTRPSMPPYGEPVGGGKTAYCWIIWDKRVKFESTKMDWLLRT